MGFSGWWFSIVTSSSLARASSLVTYYGVEFSTQLARQGQTKVEVVANVS
jgi:hypothetical protein